jgi:hypothetical protein
MNKSDHFNASPMLLELFLDLRKRGYVNTFYRDPSRLYCIESRKWIVPAEFHVDESHYFTNETALDTDRDVYAISTTHKLKGILIDASGVYKDNIGIEMAQKLKSMK